MDHIQNQSSKSTICLVDYYLPAPIAIKRFHGPRVSNSRSCKHTDIEGLFGLLALVRDTPLSQPQFRMNTTPDSTVVEAWLIKALLEQSDAPTQRSGSPSPAAAGALTSVLSIPASSAATVKDPGEANDSFNTTKIPTFRILRSLPPSPYCNREMDEDYPVVSGNSYLNFLTAVTLDRTLVQAEIAVVDVIRHELFFLSIVAIAEKRKREKQAGGLYVGQV